MSTSVGTKSKKKQSTSSAIKAKKRTISPPDRKFESAILSLENTCLSIIESQYMGERLDTEGRYWQQIFVNIATPVSLALMESKGPRHFHYHYRHRKEDQSVLRPVLENPVDMLAQVCRDALKHCQNQLVGIQDQIIAKRARTLELALQSFLLSYNKFKDKKG